MSPDAAGRARTRSLEVTEALVRAYSRRGNFHSDPAISAGLQLPGLVAQGVQAAGPAYGILLDAWGEAFLTHGEIEMRFVGMVLAGDTIEARAELAHETDATAKFTVENTTQARTAVVGTARRSA